MQFNNTTTKQGILQQIEIVTGLGLTAITGDTNQLAYFTNLVNIWLHITGHWIHTASPEWNFDDANNTGLPIEEYSFTDEQDNYGLDSDIKVIWKVEVRDAVSLKYSTIDLKLREDIPEDTFGEDAGTPEAYWFSGRSIIFYPNPDTAKVDKYRLTYDRSMHLFTTSDTTAEPGFDITFHPILVYGPAREWAYLAKKQEVITLCDRMLGDPPQVPSGFYKALREHYFRQNRDFAPAIGRKSKSFK